MDKEIFKPIKGYEGLYEISNYGQVKSLDRDVEGPNKRTRIMPEKIMTGQISRTGYAYIILSKNKRVKKHQVSRLVGAAFVPNPENKPQINHIDENKTNNYYKNLEWCTRTENMRHNGLMDKLTTKFKLALSKKVYQYSEELSLIKVWDSGMDAQRAGFTGTAISACCNGYQKTHKGFVWSLKPLHGRNYSFEIDGECVMVFAENKEVAFKKAIEKGFSVDKEINCIRFISKGILIKKKPEYKL